MGIFDRIKTALSEKAIKAIAYRFLRAEIATVASRTVTVAKAHGFTVSQSDLESILGDVLDGLEAKI